ncbi:MAG: siderophore-interacting protein [Actinomycetota bacterium]|nr:siderophore-interacting protein [Actinomycetota bacterium]
MPSLRLRRQPPPFRLVEVVGTERLSPRMVRVTLGGPELEGFAVDQPAASVRLLLPSPGTHDLVIPSWNGNEFLLPDGRRPAIRTFTPHWSGAELSVDVVLHGHGVASEWAGTARPGDRAAVSGPGRGYAVDRDAPGFLLAGDETAIPAIGQLLEVLPDGCPVEVHVEIADDAARLPLPAEWHALPPGARPGEALVAAVTSTDLAPGTRVWVAGEAAAVQRIRKHLFQHLGLPRTQATVRGYWKHGRAGDAEGD